MKKMNYCESAPSSQKFLNEILSSFFTSFSSSCKAGQLIWSQTFAVDTCPLNQKDWIHRTNNKTWIKILFQPTKTVYLTVGSKCVSPNVVTLGPYSQQFIFQSFWIGPKSWSVTLQWAGNASQGQTLYLTEPILKLPKKWCVVNTHPGANPIKLFTAIIYEFS